ncbi:hypothetical protein ACFSC4_28275 [Deinococcus malanensis]|uniref:hypothetical protein n=1 Tax=Deinococcus malanensis TaxID=1706855 RepID=UPI003644DAA8
MAKGKRPPVSAGFDDTISRVQSAAVPVEVGVRDLTPFPDSHAGPSTPRRWRNSPTASGAAACCNPW